MKKYFLVIFILVCGFFGYKKIAQLSEKTEVTSVHGKTTKYSKKMSKKLKLVKNSKKEDPLAKINNSINLPVSDKNIIKRDKVSEVSLLESLTEEQRDEYDYCIKFEKSLLKGNLENLMTSFDKKEVEQLMPCVKNNYASFKLNFPNKETDITDKMLEMCLSSYSAEKSENLNVSASENKNLCSSFFMMQKVKRIKVVPYDELEDLDEESLSIQTVKCSFDAPAKLMVELEKDKNKKFLTTSIFDYCPHFNVINDRYPELYFNARMDCQRDFEQSDSKDVKEYLNCQKNIYDDGYEGIGMQSQGVVINLLNGALTGEVDLNEVNPWAVLNEARENSKLSADELLIYEAKLEYGINNDSEKALELLDQVLEEELEASLNVRSIKGQRDILMEMIEDQKPLPIEYLNILTDMPN